MQLQTQICVLARLQLSTRNGTLYRASVECFVHDKVLGENEACLGCVGAVENTDVYYEARGQKSG